MADIACMLESAFRWLPDGFEVRVCVERGACWVSLWEGEDEVDLGAEPTTIGEIPAAIERAFRCVVDIAASTEDPPQG